MGSGDVLSLQAIYGIAVMLFKVPTGAICDMVGRRRTILCGAALNLLGWTAFALLLAVPLMRRLLHPTYTPDAT